MFIASKYEEMYAPEIGKFKIHLNIYKNKFNSLKKSCIVHFNTWLVAPIRKETWDE